MPESTEDLIVHNLIETVDHLRADLDRMELWATALGCFRHPIPDYRPADQNLLTPSATRPRRTGS